MKKRKLLIRIVAWAIIAAMVAAFLIEIAFAQQAMPSTPPQNITVNDIAYGNEGGQNWYAEFVWGAPKYPDEATGQRTQTFFFNRVQRGTGHIENDILEFTLDGGSTSLVTSDYGLELEHGMIYEFYGRSSYTYGELGEYTFTSGRSNRVRFLTDLEFGAELISGTNEIKIVWDDVWDTDGRIDYRILISDTSGFTQPPSIPDIIGSDIGTENSRVTVTGNRLEYVYTNALPGREYSIKVIPLVKSDVETIPESEIPVLRVKTEILLRAKKMGETTNNIRWMLFWDPIIKGSIGSTTFTRVEYRLYRYDAAGTETFFALVTDKDRFEMNLERDDVDKYKYKIEAMAYKPDGSTVPFYSTTQVSLKEQIPEYPSSPEFVDGFPNADPQPLIFDELLTDSSATLLWKVPVTGEGKVDTDIYYDLYLVENLDDISILPITRRIGTNLTMGEENKVRELEKPQNLIGYRYPLTNLKSNATYYAVLIAKKNFLTESNDGSFMVTRPYLSESSVKVIITRPDTTTDQPLAPSTPPFRLKPDTTPGKNGFTLQMEKSWLEMYDPDLGRWLYVVREDDPEGELSGGPYNATNSFTWEEYSENKQLPDGDAAKKPERIVEYDAGSEILIHCVEYEDALRIIGELQDREYVTYSDLSKSYLLALQKQIPPVSVPDIQPPDSPVFPLPVMGLDPNKTYLVWITVKNRSGQLESEPSNPLLVTTQPDIPPQTETPVVPNDLRGVSADTYVDLFWSYRTGYTYNISYGTEEDRTKAQATITISSEQLGSQPWVRVDALEADTVYYFWLQAVSSPDDGAAESEWSNPLIIRTEKYSPPPRPRGFGIKNIPDAITQNSIFYEWLPDESVTFILEISETADFEEVEEYQVDGSEYQVTGLNSNYRYFARLFSYSPDTGLRSEPTATIMIVTRKGRGEYDADVPLEDIPVGEIVIIDPVATDGVWRANVTGINAHRLSEKIRKSTSGPFSIDLSNPPPMTEIVRLELDGEVLETLSGVKESLILKTPGFDIAISPGSLLEDNYFRLKQKLGNIRVRVDVKTPVYTLRPEKNRQFALPVTEMKILAGIEESYQLLGEFTRPIKVTLPVEKVRLENVMMRFYDSEQGKWSSIENTWIPSEGKIAAYPQKSGSIAATQIQADDFQDISGNSIQKTIHNITRLYAMPSLPGRELKPDAALTVEEGMKHIFDIIPYEYGRENIAWIARRSGFMLPSNAKKADEPLQKDEAIYAVLAVLGKKTGRPVSGDIQISEKIDDFDDFEKIAPAYRSAAAYAIENGVIAPEWMYNPEESVTRGELLIMIEKMLMLAGEL